MVVQEIMTKRPVTISVTRPLTEALALLQELDVRHLPVVDQGELVGILSDRDLLPFRDADLAGTAPSKLPRVSEVMSSDIISVDPETEVEEAIDLMLEHRVGALPVVSPATQRLVGILSYVDILKAVKGTV